MAAFADRLQDAVDLDAVRADLLATVSTSLQPAHAVGVAAGAPAMSAPGSARRARLASPRTASLLAACVLVLIAALPVIGALSHHLTSGSLTAVISLLVVILVIAAVGLVVARHQPGNAIGWLLLSAAAWIPLTIAASEYATLVYDYGSPRPPGARPGGGRPQRAVHVRDRRVSPGHPALPGRPPAVAPLAVGAVGPTWPCA